MRDETLGELAVRDSALCLHVATPFGPVELTVRLEGASVSESLDAARWIVATLSARLARAQDELATVILPTLNRGYLEQGKPPISREEFLRRARLRSLDADADGNTTFHFDDDDMLWGHHLMVECDRDGVRWRAAFWG